MDDEFAIEWDEEYAEDLNTLAHVFFTDTPSLWPALLTRLAENPASFLDDDDDEYGLADILECSGGDLGNDELTGAFLQVLRGEGLIEDVDWKGEYEEGQLAVFAASRYYALTKDALAAEELKTHLLEITRRDEIEKVWKKGDRFVDKIFERIQQELNARGFQIASFNESTDAYNVFVLPINDYEKINDFNTPWLEVQDFLS